MNSFETGTVVPAPKTDSPPRPQEETTSVTGAPVTSHAASQIMGAGIPLHDHYLIEKLAHFNRERVPERVVHAKGGGAFGVLKITNDVSGYTRARLFQPGVATPMLIRFSSVAGEKGSPDTWRDPRGFAMKFYTPEGNYDLVGNNTPVFFIRDGIKFPDFIRSQKRLPGSHLRDNDMQWDFWTQSPESAHQVTWLMGDRGLPASWRHMNGYGSHTYQWINARGERFWVKYHFKTCQGHRTLTQEQGDILAGQDADLHIRDLYENIEMGNFPKWDLFVQIMPYEDAYDYRFNPFDLTKVWPHGDYPLVRVGTMTLNRNPQNYFAEIEQAAFEPSAFVPGIAPSPDRMLLARIFSYADAHRYRIGVNYHQIPVNSPKAAPKHNYSSLDGRMRLDFNSPNSPVYYPNTRGGSVDAPEFAPDSAWTNDARLARCAEELHAQDDDFGQPGVLVREVMNEQERQRLLSNITGHVGGVKNPDIRARAIEYWKQVDGELGQRLAHNLG